MDRIGELSGKTTGGPGTPAAAPIELETPNGTLVVRLAAPQDEPALRRLFSSITMDADLSLRVDREPDFFALYEIQGDAVCEPWVGILDGELVGLGTLVARNGYLGGEVRRIGYLGDLRLDPRIRGREVLATLYGPCLDGFATRHGVGVFYTAVIASNARAVRALTGPSAHDLGIPTYHLLQRFSIRAVQTIGARRPGRAARRTWRVRRASEADLPALARLLDHDARTRAFGAPIDADRLERSFARWPGLAVEDVHLLERRDTGELVGSLAPWDATPVKQTVVTAYRGSMRWVRRSYDIAATLVRAPRLPAPGSALRYCYATHHAVTDPDPEAARLLVHAAWRSVRASGGRHVFLSCRVPRSDGSEAPYEGFVTNDLPANLYAVVPHGGDLPVELHDANRFGFEMALV